MPVLSDQMVAIRADANVRIAKYTVLVKSVTNTSTQKNRYAAVPAGANAAGIMGVAVEHFVEPNFFVKEGTDPTTVTGTTPTLYNLMNRPITVWFEGAVARCYAAGAINQGDEVNVADAFGRVKTVNEAAGTQVFVVGIAQNQTAAANDIVEVLLSFYVKKT